MPILWILSIFVDQCYVIHSVNEFVATFSWGSWVVFLWETFGMVVFGA